MSEPFDSYEHAGLTVELHHDPEPTSPREWSNVGTIAADPSGDFGMWDVSVHEDVPDTDTCPRCKGKGQRAIPMPDYGNPTNTTRKVYVDCARCDGAGEIELAIVEGIKQGHKARVVLPLHYSGSLAAASIYVTDDPDDANAWIFDTPEDVRECIGEDATDEQIKAALEAEVKTLDQYLSGEVYGYVVRGPNGEDVSDLGATELDSCWGFFDEHPYEYLKGEASEAAECIAEQIAAEKAEAAHWAARDVETVA
jgi:hypothetical protein